MSIDVPVWDLDSALSELGCTPAESTGRLVQSIGDLAEFYDANLIHGGPALEGTAELAALFDDMLARTDPLLRLERILSCWHAGRCWADGTDAVAATQYSHFQERTAGLSTLSARLDAWAARLPLTWLIDNTTRAADHLPWLQRCHHRATFPSGQASMLAELDLHGRDALIALHTQMSAEAAGPLDGAEVPVVLLQQHLTSQDRRLRHRAHEAIAAAWTPLSKPAAVCLNALTGREWALARRSEQPGILTARLVQDGLRPSDVEALHDTVQRLLPTLRAFTRAKAAILGVARLSYCDLAAPLPEEQPVTWPEATSLVTSAFAQLCPQLGAHAREAFTLRWIDAQRRAGKRTRAFCLPLAGEQSRVMLNFDGTYDSVHSLAHELGHAFQYRCHIGHTEWQRSIGLGLAETGSMVCEMLLARSAQTPRQYLGLLHASLIGIFQTIAGGYARYAFEHAMMMRRRTRPLGPAEMTGLALDAQQRVYEDAFCAESLPGHLWISHPHLYTSRFTSVSYYFGLLFGLSILDLDAPGADGRLTTLLTLAGALPPAQLAERFGYDLGSAEFWQRGASEITRRVAAFTDLAGKSLAAQHEMAGAS